MNRILAVFAHPDDEFSVSGLLTKSVYEDHAVMLVCSTRGEAGKIRNGKSGTWDIDSAAHKLELLIGKMVFIIKCPMHWWSFFQNTNAFSRKIVIR